MKPTIYWHIQTILLYTIIITPNSAYCVYPTDAHKENKPANLIKAAKPSTEAKSKAFVMLYMIYKLFSNPSRNTLNPY